MIKDDIKCFLVFSPEILIINSHGALLEKSYPYGYILWKFDEI